MNTNALFKPGSIHIFKINRNIYPLLIILPAPNIFVVLTFMLFLKSWTIFPNCWLSFNSDTSNSRGPDTKWRTDAQQTKAQLAEHAGRSRKGVSQASFPIPHQKRERQDQAFWTSNRIWQTGWGTGLAAGPGSGYGPRSQSRPRPRSWPWSTTW